MEKRVKAAEAKYGEASEKAEEVRVPRILLLSTAAAYDAVAAAYNAVATPEQLLLIHLPYFLQLAEASSSSCCYLL
jgi:hypothetical protein